MKVIFLTILIKKTNIFKIYILEGICFSRPSAFGLQYQLMALNPLIIFLQKLLFFSFLYPQWTSDLINEQCCGSSARPCHKTQGHLTQHYGDLRWKNYNHYLVDVPFSQLGHATNRKPHINTTTTLKATESGSLETSPNKSRDLLKL